MNPNNPNTSNTPVTEAKLQAYVDRELTPERQREIEGYLTRRPEEAQRVESYLKQKLEIRTLFDPVMDEPLPARIRQAARRPRTPWYLQRFAAGIAIAVVSGSAGWGLHSGMGIRRGVQATRHHALNAPPLQISPIDRKKPV